MKKLLLLIFLLIFSSFILTSTFAQTATIPAECKEEGISNLNECENYLKKKRDEKRTEGKTLASQIAVMDSQIRLTEVRILATKQEIADLALDIGTANDKIDTLEQALDGLTKILLNRIVVTYQVGTIQPFEILLSSSNASSFFSRLNYLRIAQAHDKEIIYQTQQAKSDYTNQKDIFEAKRTRAEVLKASLDRFTAQLAQEKASKQTLLTETRGSEAVYQSLLAQVQAQLAALSNFATSRFGTSLVPHQELSDGWGKYYNQRDANWGNNSMGLSSESIAAVGCLITSYSMVVTHYGGSISPAEVAANSGNFWFSTALFLKPGPTANGHSVQAVSGPSLDTLRNELNGGNAVIVGISYDGGPIADHWVVLRSVDGDSFRINDPLYAGAMNVLFTDNYASMKIVEARIYR